MSITILTIERIFFGLLPANNRSHNITESMLEKVFANLGDSFFFITHTPHRLFYT